MEGLSDEEYTVLGDDRCKQMGDDKLKKVILKAAIHDLLR